MGEIRTYNGWKNSLSRLNLLGIQLVNSMKKAPDAPETRQMIEEFNTLRNELHEYRISNRHEFEPPHKRLPPPKRPK